MRVFFLPLRRRKLFSLSRRSFRARPCCAAAFLGMGDPHPSLYGLHDCYNAAFFFSIAMQSKRLLFSPGPIRICSSLSTSAKNIGPTLFPRGQPSSLATTGDRPFPSSQGHAAAQVAFQERNHRDLHLPSFSRTGKSMTAAFFFSARTQAD